MKLLHLALAAACGMSGTATLAAEPQSAAAPNSPTAATTNQPDAWTRTLDDRAKRGTLQDAFQFVRGDTGRWSDEPTLLYSPTPQTSGGKGLDDWFDRCLNSEPTTPTAGSDNWLLLRTRQLDDNDRVWIDRIERRGNEFRVVAHEAIWQGRYQKTFTYYDVFGVNLGKLEPGEYHAKWILRPLEFKQFDGMGQTTNLWPKDDAIVEGRKPVELQVRFTVKK